MKPSLTAIFLTALPQLAVAAPSDPELFANHPAARWDHAYPVGNGTMGGMSLGSFPNETIVLNNDTIWSQPKRAALAPGCRTKDMAEAFALALKGDYAAAQGVYCRARDKGNRIASYQGLGALEISHLGIPEKPVAIQRRLDLMTGESTSTATLADGTVRETLLASYPDHCPIVRLETTRADGLHCRFKMNRQAAVTSLFAKGNELGYDGQRGTATSTSTSMSR